MAKVDIKYEKGRGMVLNGRTVLPIDKILDKKIQEKLQTPSVERNILGQVKRKVFSRIEQAATSHYLAAVQAVATQSERRNMPSTVRTGGVKMLSAPSNPVPVSWARLDEHYIRQKKLMIGTPSSYWYLSGKTNRAVNRASTSLSTQAKIYSGSGFQFIRNTEFKNPPSANLKKLFKRGTDKGSYKKHLDIKGFISVPEGSSALEKYMSKSFLNQPVSARSMLLGVKDPLHLRWNERFDKRPFIAPIMQSEGKALFTAILKAI